MLIDFGNAVTTTENNGNGNVVKKNDKALFSQLQFENANSGSNNNNQQFNHEAYNHNQQIFNKLNIDFGDDSGEENYANAYSNNNNNNNFNPSDNNNNVNYKFICIFIQKTLFS